MYREQNPSRTKREQSKLPIKKVQKQRFHFNQNQSEQEPWAQTAGVKLNLESKTVLNKLTEAELQHVESRTGARDKELLRTGTEPG